MQLIGSYNNKKYLRGIGNNCIINAEDRETMTIYSYHGYDENVLRIFCFVLNASAPEVTFVGHNSLIFIEVRTCIFYLVYCLDLGCTILRVLLAVRNLNHLFL